MTDMWIETLGNNSAEHYYLISEIEQKAEFIHLNQPETQENILQHAMTFLYTLWRPEEEDNKAILKKVQQLADFAINSKKLDVTSTCLIIDGLIPSNKVFDQALKARLNSLFQDIELLVPGIGLCVIGIVDNSAGTPGLEKLHDLIERILPGYVQMNKLSNLISLTDVDMMGHDPSRDPDGASHVHQYLCLSKY